MERVALDLCAHCLAGCFDHPNASGHLCLSRGCAMNGAKVLYLGLAAHVKPIATFHQQEAESVLRLINAAKVVMDEADWLSRPFMELRDALAGVAGYDLSALSVPEHTPGPWTYVGGSDAPGPLDAPAAEGRTTDPPAGGSSGASLASASCARPGCGHRQRFHTCWGECHVERYVDDAEECTCREFVSAPTWRDSMGREAYTSYTDALALPRDVHGSGR